MSEYAEAHASSGDDWTMIHGDCIEATRDMPDESVDLSVFSPPFISLYTYTDSPRDMGNSSDPDTFFSQFGYLIENLLRITKTGRLACVHVAQVPAMLGRDGYIGLKDFRGQTINAFSDRGWVYHGEVCIDKCPQKYGKLDQFPSFNPIFFPFSIL